jgi:uncharacterized protein YkwD
MNGWSIAFVAALGGCGQMYKSKGGHDQPAQPAQAGPPGGAAPAAADPWNGQAQTAPPAPAAAEAAQPPAPEPPRAPDPPRAPEPASPAGGTDAQRLIAAHNKVRAQHCAPPLTWSAKLAQVAQQWANNLRDQGCKFGHSGGQYGENLAAGTTGAMDPEAVVAMWYDEIKGYSFKQPGFSMQTGHFTQVVWRSTTQVGCGVAQCKGNDIWVCNYDPPGNWEGQYPQQVLAAGCKP